MPSLQAQAIDIVEVIAARDECEIMADLATPYPSQVFLTLFGLPLEDRERLIAWKDAIISMSLETELDSADLVAGGGALRVPLAVRSLPIGEHPGDDMLSGLARGR